MRCASVRAPPRSARRGAPRALSTRASPPSTPPPPRPPPPGPPAGADRWTELRRLLAAGPSTHGEDFGRRVRKLVRPGEEASAVWAVARREAQASVLAAMAPTSGQLAQIVGAVLHAHPSANARTAGEALAPLVRHVGAGYSLDELRRALSPLPAQLERLAPEAMRAVPAGDSEWASGEVWGSLLGQAVPEPLRDDYEGVAAAVVQLLKAPWARAAPAPTGPPRALYSLRHAVRLGTSALAEFDQDWVNEEMFDAARTLQNELAQHFHQVHPGEAFGPAEYAALMTDLVTLLVQKLRRDTWTNVGFVNALVHHLSGEHVRGDDFIRFVHDVKSNLRGTLPQRLQAFAVDLAAPLTGRSYQWPPVRLRSIC